MPPYRRLPRRAQWRYAQPMRIGFIGLGMMGHHMAANLQKAGHDLVVFDVRREAGDEALARGAKWAETRPTRRARAKSS